VADSGEESKFVGIGGKLTMGEQEDGLSEGVKKAGAPVVAEALPLAQDGGLGGAGEGCPVREAAKPSTVVGKNGGDARLLAHKLRNGDMVGGGRGAPREGSLMALKPAVEKG